MSSPGLKQEARTGFAAAGAYDVHHPTYTPEAVEQLLNALEVAGVEHAKIADLAAGTGNFTEALAARSEKYEIVAIEPHDDMREQLKQKNLPGVTVAKGTAEDMSELPSGSFAALIAAQSFHWFANMNALSEMSRVLQPTGVLGMIWNIEDYNAPRSWDVHPGWEATMRDLVWTFDDNQPRFRHEEWKKVFDNQTSSNPLSVHFANPLFSLPIGEAFIPFESWLSREDIWNRMRTLSQFAVLEGEECEKARKQFVDAINLPGTQVDEHGRVPVHGRTVIAWTSRIPGEPLRSGG